MYLLVSLHLLHVFLKIASWINAYLIESIYER